MRTLSTTSRLCAAFAALMIAALCPSGRAQSTVPPPEPDRPVSFGILGITRGQTARINVTNIGNPPPDPENPATNPVIPPPSRVLMSFLDTDGDAIRNSAGDPVRRVVILRRGEPASLQINGDVFVPRGQLRLNFRPAVVVASTAPALPPDPCTPVLEVIDNLLGRTQVVYGGIPNPVAPSDAGRPVSFGITGVGHLQTARINVTNIGITPPDPDFPVNTFPPDPCRVTMAFVDTDGNVIRNQAGQPVVRVVILQPGESAFLQINADNFIGRDQLRFNFRPVVVVASLDPAVPPDPCTPVLEVIDNLMARTLWVYGGTPNLNPPSDPDRQQ